jgi:hypothetical protein
VQHALGALVHTLVDLIDERERRARLLGEGHEVQDGGQGTFLKKSRNQSARVQDVAEKEGKVGLTPPDWR